MVLLTAVFMALLLFIPHTILANAAPKPTIGVLNFRSNNADGYGIVAADHLIGDIARLRSCNIVERTELNRVFDEKVLSDTGIVEKIRSGAGKGKGLNYVLMGTISVSVSRYETRDRNNRITYAYQNSVTMNARLIDAYNEMGQIIWTSKPVTVTHAGQDSESIRESIEEAAYDTVRDLYQFFPIKGYVIKVDRGKYYIDLGADIGVKVKDKLIIQGVSDKMIHPVTGKQIDVVTTAGKLEVIEVYNEFCVAEPDNKKDQLKIFPGDTVIRELKSKPRNLFGMWTGGHSF
jgi:hypothetical protein